MKFFLSITLALSALFSALVPLHAFAITPEETLVKAKDQCGDRAFQMIREERDAYRRVQFGEEWSVVRDQSDADTSDLVPYLVLNYHALDCRLSALCDAVWLSHGHLGSGALLPPMSPVGCSRLFSARGRWWTEENRDLPPDPDIIPECNYRGMQTVAESVEITQSYLTVAADCRGWVTQILEEERQVLRLLVAQDSAERGTQRVVGVFQTVLGGIRENLLKPLRSMVSLMGSLLHPIPCLLSQCN